MEKNLNTQKQLGFALLPSKTIHCFLGSRSFHSARFSPARLIRVKPYFTLATKVFQNPN